MPLYEYQCRECHARFERLTRHENADTVACPHCGEDRARRLLSVFASFTPSAAATVAPTGGGCACGGHCGCGGH